MGKGILAFLSKGYTKKIGPANTIDETEYELVTKLNLKNMEKLFEIGMKSEIFPKMILYHSRCVWGINFNGRLFGIVLDNTEEIFETDVSQIDSLKFNHDGYGVRQPEFTKQNGETMGPFGHETAGQEETI